MKQRVTLTLEDHYVSFLDQVAVEAGQSRSAIVERIIADYWRHQRRAELARQAAQFFAQQETPDETAERADWEALGLEVMSRDD